MTNDGEFLIKETFKLKISSANSTEITYRTETNIQGDPVANSTVLTHIANILYALLMLETGYNNGLIQKER
jgi:hypothetical protein